MKEPVIKSVEYCYSGSNDKLLEFFLAIIKDYLVKEGQLSAPSAYEEILEKAFADCGKA